MKSKARLVAFSDADLVQQFAEWSKRHGMAILDSDVGRANRIYNKIEEIETELRARGREARLKLATLLSDQDRLVRYYAAKYLLGLVPEQARSVIEENARWWKDAISFDAGMTLHFLDTGISKPD